MLSLRPAFADKVPFGAQWRYIDYGSTPQSGWQYPDFDDSQWLLGFAQLGFGDGDEETLVNFGPDANNKPITTYFRHQFDLPAVISEPLTLRVRRDDAVIVYLNGIEVFRDNIREGAVGANTRAIEPVFGTDETALQTTMIDAGLFNLGANTLAVEVHLANRSSVDLSFDLQLTDSPVVRGPYLQQSSETGITVRWRTATEHDSTLRYGTNAANLDQIANNNTASTDHAITLNGLTPDTRYYYSVGDSAGEFAVEGELFFDTHPQAGSAAATRIWVLGDSGTADAKAASVRQSYTQFNNGTHSDVLLMLGDNAYEDGRDDEYQAAVFEMYPQVLRNTVLWPTLGNHDAITADSSTQSGNYYDIFTLPTNGESGGMASGTEAYYSFDYANIHFVSLDSHDTDRSADGAMARWLENDLAANTQEWLIAYWHHPPYSKGSHDSDSKRRLIDMRTNFLPILESYGVDLVLAGHSHSYERSMLINGHYGMSSEFNQSSQLDAGDGNPDGDGAYDKFANTNNGAVYSVAGSSGKITNAPLNHPVMVTNLVELGSMVIDVQGNQLDAIFLDDNAIIRDSFRIVHQETNPPIDPVEIANAVLDHNRGDGPRWMRVDFDPLNTGTHTIRTSWDGDADIRFSLFRVRADMSVQLIDRINQASPAEWTGMLDSADRYYLGVWSASGSTSFTTVIEAEEAGSNPVVTIDEGTLDASRTVGPRWVRLGFEPLSSGQHNIVLAWDNSDADVRYRVKEADGTNLSPTIRGANPGSWTGDFQLGTQYYISVWSTKGVTGYTATMELNDGF